MNSTKIINIVLVVVVLVAIAWGLSFLHAPQTASQETQHALSGQPTAQGDYLYSDNAAYYDIEVHYPAHTALTGEADSKARLLIEQELAADIEQFKSDGNFANLTPEDIQIQGLGGDRKYSYGAEYKEFTSGSTDSFLFVIYEDTLGAHPNGYFKSYVFDKNGKALAINDLFTPGSNYLARLAQASETQIKAQLNDRLGADASSSVFADGYAPSEQNFQNFIIDGDTLHVYFPPYQVAAYAAGAFDVAIPLSQLSDILAPGVR
jgi:hypothetical protein